MTALVGTGVPGDCQGGHRRRDQEGDHRMGACKLQGRDGPLRRPCDLSEYFTDQGDMLRGHHSG